MKYGLGNRRYQRIIKKFQKYIVKDIKTYGDTTIKGLSPDNIEDGINIEILRIQNNVKCNLLFGEC